MWVCVRIFVSVWEYIQMFVYMCAYVYLYTTYMCLVSMKVRRKSDSLELELQTVCKMLADIGAGNRTQVKSNNVLKCWVNSPAAPCIFFQTVTVTRSFIRLPWIVSSLEKDKFVSLYSQNKVFPGFERAWISISAHPCLHISIILKWYALHQAILIPLFCG